MDEYIGIIQLFAGDYAPQSYLYCAGQILNTSQYAALFSVFGNIYGGDGSANFALPDLRGRVAVGCLNGKRPATNFISAATKLGAIGGQEYTTLDISNLANHTHDATFTGTGGGNGTPVRVQTTLSVSTNQATESVAGTNGAYTLGAAFYGDGGMPAQTYVDDPAPTVQLAGISTLVSGGGGSGITGGYVSIDPTGAGEEFNNCMPYVVLNYVMCVEGLYPPRP